MLPLAHVGHYLWTLYVLPILIVVAAIIKSFISQRQATNASPAGGDDREDSPGRESPDRREDPRAGN